MISQIRISARTLGQISLSDFCPRCFWIKRHAIDLPFQIFPGIFSSIDSYSKRVIHKWFDRHGTSPNWLSDLGPLSGYREPPHFSKFNKLYHETNILLTGTPDAIFVRPDKSFLIADYKTARYTGTQDALYPMYRTQLNAYAAISESCGFSPVTDLALIYTEPVTSDKAANVEEIHREGGFMMEFSARVHKVDLEPKLIHPLLERTREILELSSAPEGARACRECLRVNSLLDIIKA